MDPVLMALAGKALQLVGPYIAKGGEKVAEALGEQIGTQLGGLVERIRARFRRDPAGAQVLDRYGADPRANEAAAQQVLAEEMERDPAFRTELERDVNRFGPVLAVVQRIQDGERITGAEIGTITRGLVQVHQDVGTARDVTGAKIDTFGG